MATVTVTETGVSIQVTMTRGEDRVDRVTYTAVSLTDVPLIAGRAARDVPIALNAPQAAVVKQVLDFIEGLAKAAWNIP